MAEGRRGAPLKTGLTYVPQRVDPMADYAIYDLVDEYGPLGYMVYDLIVKDVLSEGYYLKLTAEKLARKLVGQIGSKWVRNRKVVEQVICYLADLDLLDADLLALGIITSVTIQGIYYETAVKRMRRRPYTEEYWLLAKDGIPKFSEKEGSEALLSVPISGIIAEENRFNSAINRFNAEEIPVERKENKTKDTYTPQAPPGGWLSDKKADEAFTDYIAMRRSAGTLTDVQITALVSTLIGISTDPEEQLLIIQRATNAGWKNFYPLPIKQREKLRTENGKRGSFFQFEQRKIDYAAQEAALLNMPLPDEAPEAQEGAG